MAGEPRKSTKTQLALALGRGVSVAAWARANEVPRRAAYKWANDPIVREALDSYRRRAVDRAVDRMARRANWALVRIAMLDLDAESESDKLTALEAILADMKPVSRTAALEGRIAQMEEQLRERAENPDRPS